MVIEESDFRLTPTSDNSMRFDLELLYEIKPKGKESRLEFKTVAYGIGLEYAMKKVAQYRVYHKHKDESIKLLTYFKEFTDELQSIRDLCEINK